MSIEILKAMLTERGFICDYALTPMSALELLEQRFELVKNEHMQNYKLILTDFSMPQVDGPTLARRIR